MGSTVMVARERRKGVVKVVERVLEGVEHVFGEDVGKRLLLVASVVEEPIMGFGANGDIVGEVAPAPTKEQVLE